MSRNSSGCRVLFKPLFPILEKHVAGFGIKYYYPAIDGFVIATSVSTGTNRYLAISTLSAPTRYQRRRENQTTNRTSHFAINDITRYRIEFAFTTPLLFPDSARWLSMRPARCCPEGTQTKSPANSFAKTIRVAL